MNLKGKNINGISILSHRTPKSAKMDKVSKEDMKEYLTIKKTADELNRYRGRHDNVREAIDTLGALQREMRANLNPKHEHSPKQTVEFEYEVPKNVSVQLYSNNGRNESRKMKDYSNKFREVIELENNMSVAEVYKKIKEKKVTKIKKARSTLKTPRTPSKAFQVRLNPDQSMSYRLQAGTHTAPDTILNFKKVKGQPSIYSPKAPRTAANHVGIELEFVCKLNRDELGLKFMLSGLSEYCELKSDGSVRDESAEGFHSHELTICVSEDQMDSVIDRVCVILNEAQCKVNKTCGMHVHLDCRSRDRAIVFNNLVGSQAIMFAMQPAVRRENRFARKTESRVIDRAMGQRVEGAEGRSGSGRYLAVNPHSLERHNTIEIRIHTGTTNASKIKNWVNMLVSIARKTILVTDEPKTAELLSEQYGLTPTVVTYIKQRMEKFKRSTVGIENENNGEAA